jgi:hypothetical protein
MNFILAGKIIQKTREKIFDARLWERWLVELQGMDKDNFISFDDYKKKVLEYSRIKNRTQEEKEIELEECRNKAREAIKRLDPLKNFGKEVKK